MNLKGVVLNYLNDNDEGMKYLITWFLNEVMQEEANQQAGVIQGLTGTPGQKGVAGHSQKFLPNEESGYFASPHNIRNYSAVTAACMMIRKSVFQKVGKFDENIAIAFNDVDLCLKIRKKKYLGNCVRSTTNLSLGREQWIVWIFGRSGG